MMNSKCYFVGIGAQKAASTWIHRILEDHPEVISSDPKELDYFSSNYDKGEDWYLAHFTSGVDSQQKIFGEISPSYFNDKNAPSRVFQHNSNIKIIVTLRDPIERLFSNHLHRIRTNSYTPRNLSLETGLAEYPEYIEQSMYYKHLKNWYEVFDDSQILVLFQEDIKKNPIESSKTVYKFLNIKSNHISIFLNRRANVSFSPKYKSLDVVFKLIKKTLNILKLGRVLKKIRQLDFVHSIKNLNKQHLSETVPVVTTELKHKLMIQFRDDLFNLSKLLNKEELPWETWNFIHKVEKDAR